MQSKGFSSIELLITLFIAAAFVLAGYQLFLSVLGRSAHSSEHAVTSTAAFAEIKRLVHNTEHDPPIDCGALPGTETYTHAYGQRVITYERSYSCPDSVKLPNLRKLTVKGTLDEVSATHSSYYRQP